MNAEPSDDTVAIEKEVERTQDAMGETIAKIEEKLSRRRIAQSLVSDESNDTARQIWEVVRESPVPVALIAGGVAWLISTSQAPLIARLRGELKSRFKSAVGSNSSASPVAVGSSASAVGPPPAMGEAYDRRSAAIDRNPD